MTYSIKWREKALKELRKLSREIAKRIIRKVDDCKDNPKQFLERLKDDPGYKLRVGDYRVLIDIIEDQKILSVRLVGHRKNIYKRNL